MTDNRPAIEPVACPFCKGRECAIVALDGGTSPTIGEGQEPTEDQVAQMAQGVRCAIGLHCGICSRLFQYVYMQLPDQVAMRVLADEGGNVVSIGQLESSRQRASIGRIVLPS